MNSRAMKTLDDGSRIGVVGGGPAGAFFSYFLLQLAGRIDVRLEVDIYERRDFSQMGPIGCNMCGGVISESLVQSLSVEGINLPSDVVQRGIDSFVFHTKEESATLFAPYHEMRIATVYRGAGPKGTRQPRWRSFDGYLLELAVSKGARVIQERVTDIVWADGKPQIQTKRNYILDKGKKSSGKIGAWVYGRNSALALVDSGLVCLCGFWRWQG